MSKKRTYFDMGRDHDKFKTNSFKYNWQTIYQPISVDNSYQDITTLSHVNDAINYLQQYMQDSIGMSMFDSYTPKTPVLNEPIQFTLDTLLQHIQVDYSITIPFGAFYPRLTLTVYIRYRDSNNKLLEERAYAANTLQPKYKTTKDLDPLTDIIMTTLNSILLYVNEFIYTHDVASIISTDKPRTLYELVNSIKNTVLGGKY